jgi:hypothetical protein
MSISMLAGLPATTETVWEAVAGSLVPLVAVTILVNLDITGKYQ